MSSRSVRMQRKVIYIIIGMVLLISIFIFMWNNKSKSDNKEYITVGESELLFEKLYEIKGITWVTDADSAKDDKLTYDTLINYTEQLEVDTQVDIETKFQELNGKYRRKSGVTKEDFYEIFWIIQPYVDTNNQLMKKDLILLGTSETVEDTDLNPLGEDLMLTNDGTFLYDSDAFTSNLYQYVEVVATKDELLTIMQINEDSITLSNMWMIDSGKEKATVFIQGYEVNLPLSASTAAKLQREQVTDLTFQKGEIINEVVKTEKISGKLLSVTDAGIELEGVGTYPVSEDAVAYKLYGTLEEVKLSSLIVGYDFTDYVVDNGTICACLITRDEVMGNIRVLIKPTDYTGAYHSEIILTCDTAYKVIFGEDIEDYEAGDTFQIKSGDERLQSGRIYIKPNALTGQIQVGSVTRAQGVPSYRGTMEITETEDGLVLVNELLLEEYLYAVVPSEMPSYYPLEALKAQAVCARTYAYKQMIKSGLSYLGAHVDDSAAYQVYNNVEEEVTTTKAVKDTSGMLMYYGDDLAGAYYYSTSCGYGSDVGVWMGEGTEDTSYLAATRIGEKESEDFTEQSLEDNDIFDKFINDTYESDYESEYAWYRWTYDVSQLSVETIEEKLKARYDADPSHILMEQEDGTYVSSEIEPIGDIHNIMVVRRHTGGVADELVITGSEHSYMVMTEHNIRCVLSDGTTSVERQDGSAVENQTMLPSAFFALTTSKDGENVVEYNIVGGGFGHGVGMSQNGAKAMADVNKTYREIIDFFYKGVTLQNVYD